MSPGLGARQGDINGGTYPLPQQDCGRKNYGGLTLELKTRDEDFLSRELYSVSRHIVPCRGVQDSRTGVGLVIT
jgi:hypothetical protein